MLLVLLKPYWQGEKRSLLTTEVFSADGSGVPSNMYPVPGLSFDAPGLETQPQTFHGVFSLTLPYIYDFSTSFSEGWRAGNASQVPENPVGRMPNVRSYSDIGYQILWWLTKLQWGESQKFVAQSHAQSCFVANWVLCPALGPHIAILEWGQCHGPWPRAWDNTDMVAGEQKGQFIEPRGKQ